MKATVKTILLCFMLLVIAAPLLQRIFHVFTPGPLYGSFTLAGDTSLTLQGWWSGGYQQQKTQYANDHVGFREDLIRVNNQIDLSLFQVLHADVVLGRGRYLYQQGYIDEHYGKVFMGYDNIRLMCEKLKFIQDYLGADGKTFLIICPPTKDDIYPEYLPYNPGLKPTLRRNAVVVKRYYDSLHINYIDVNSIFKKKKTETNEPLFTQEGIHWGVYASYVAVDTIIKWLERERHIQLPELKVISIEHTSQPRLTDNDLGWPLNLIVPFAKPVYTYPKVDYLPATAKKIPSAVIVGDSFNWTLIDDSLTAKTMNKWQFWYYFNDVKNAKNRDAPLDALPIAGYNWKGALDSTDLLMINFAPHNLEDMNRFTDSAYNYFKKRGGF